MIKENFNKNWNILDQRGKKSRVDLPFDAMIYEQRDSNSLGGINISYFIGGHYTFLKKFSYNKKEEIVYLKVGGIYQTANIYLNDTRLHHEDYGYNSYFVNLTDFLKEDNEIRIEVDNNSQPNSRWYTGSGIYRNLELIYLPVNHLLVDEVFINTSFLGDLVLNLNSNDNGTAKVSLFDENILIFENSYTFDKKIQIKEKIDDIIPWDSENPKLYRLVIDYENDHREYEIGFRSIELNQNGLLINNHREILYGACIHHDNGPLGAVEDIECAYRKIALLKKAGYNAIRSAHNPISEELLIACDHLGMYILDEYVDCWFMHKTKYDYAAYATSNYQRDLSLMVKKDYNHPSVIMYSTGNEVGESHSKKGIEFARQMTEVLHSLDSTRPVTCGINIFFNFLSSINLGVYSDKKAEKEVKVKKKEKKKSVGSEFFNDLAGKLGANFMKRCATLYPCDVTTRGVFSKLDVAGYNYGIYRYKHDLKKYKSRYILGSETFCSDAPLFYRLAKDNPRILGDFVWAGMDYIGEVGVGSWTKGSYCDNDFSHGLGWLTAGSGRIDVTGRFNSEVDFTLVSFDKKVIAIGVVPFSDYKEKASASAWKYSAAYPIYNYPGYEGQESEIEVYSKTPYISLYINDKLIKTKKNNAKCKLVFKMKYEPGTLTAKGLDKNRNIICETSLSSGEGQPNIKVTKENSYSKDPSLVFYRIQIRDDKEILPGEKTFIRIEDIENALFEGLGNGCSYNLIGYKKIENNTFYGEILLILRKLNKKGVKYKIVSKYGIDIYED